MPPTRSRFPVSHEAPVVALACRRAGLAFIGGVRRGWSKRDLERWLAEDYAAVTIRLDGEHDGPSAESVLPPSHLIELSELVGVAVTEALRGIDVDPAAILDPAIRSGALIELKQEDGDLWMPADRPNLDIETRVLSLFATDYLLHPDTYEEDLCVCEECDHVSFDAFGQCPLCTSEQSGIRRLIALAPEKLFAS